MHGISAVTFGVVGLLGLATLLVPVAARTNVAFSLVLAISGIALGTIATLFPLVHSIGPVGDFIHAVSQFNLSSETFILIFLPALLFETGIAIDVRRLMDDLGPILLLAVVAVLLSTFVVGFSLAAVTEIGLVACLLLAAIVSTTDPIAVVGIFRDLGVPHRLNLLVEGESLFNDAAAISLFALFMAMLTGERQVGIGEALLSFGRGFVGGLVFGYLCGRMVCWSFRLLRNERAAEVTMTVAAAYLIFLAGEHYLHVSGVVAVVTAALVISYEGRTRVSDRSWASLKDVWQQVGYWASALIFLLATMRVPGLLTEMTLADFFTLAVLIVSALAARALVLFGLLPGLSALGWAQPVAFSLRAVVLWGGLRGAISLALALAVVENPNVPAPVKSFVAVMCTAFVLFTLFVNAPLLRPLIHLFGLDKLPASDGALRGRAIATALRTVRCKVQDAASDYGIEETLAARLTDSFTERLSTAEAAANGDLPLDADSEIISGLGILTAREQSLYLRYYHDGIITGAVTRTLLGGAVRLQDGLKTNGRAGYEDAHKAHLGFGWKFRLALTLHRRLGIERFISAAIAVRFESLLIERACLREVMNFIETNPNLTSSSTIATALAEVIEGRLADVETALSGLRLQYVDFANALQQQYLERTAVRVEEVEYLRLRNEAVISQELLNDLLSELDDRNRRLANRPPLDLQLSPRELIAKVPLFAALSGDQTAQLTRLLRPMLSFPGDTIITKGEPGTCMYFLVSGAIEVRTGQGPLLRGSGEFFGELALLSNAPRNADVVALGFCSLLILDKRDFHALLDTSAELRKIISITAQMRLAETG